MEMIFGLGVLLTSVLVSGSLYYYSTAHSEPQETELLPLYAPTDVIPQLFISPEIDLDFYPSLSDD